MRVMKNNDNEPKREITGRIGETIIIDDYGDDILRSDMSDINAALAIAASNANISVVREQRFVVHELLIDTILGKYDEE